MISQRRQAQLQQVMHLEFPQAAAAEFQLLGNGDFHSVYQVSVGQHPAMVLKFRKRFPYGETDDRSAGQLLGEYQGTALFYQALADTELGVPAIYRSATLAGQCWVLESKLEYSRGFASLSAAEAYQAGCTLARSLIHAYRLPAPCPGSGKLIVNDVGELLGQNQSTAAFQQEFEKHRFSTLLQEITVAPEQQWLLSALQRSYQLLAEYGWPLTLVNEDLHPENLVIADDGRLAVMDPQVSLDSGLRFLAHFWVNCHYFWPLLLGQQLAQSGDLPWVLNLAPLADGFRQTCVAEQVSVAGFNAESYLRVLYLVWRHQEYISGRSEQGSNHVLGSQAEATARLPQLLLQLKQLAMLLIEVNDE